MNMCFHGKEIYQYWPHTFMVSKPEIRPIMSCPFVCAAIITVVCDNGGNTLQPVSYL
jgi:hypothetical protein